MQEDNSSEVKGLLINPSHAITFAPHIFTEHSSLSSKEDWVAANAHTMNEIGAKTWLGELLDTLSQPREKYDGHDIINPTTVINVSRRLQDKGKSLVNREDWIQANAKLVAEISRENWLWQLLETLETGGSTTK